MYERVTITIEMENAAFQDNEDHEIACILSGLASKIGPQGLYDRTILDHNGNEVGKLIVT